MQTNDKDLYIDIGEIVDIFEKTNIKEISQEDWNKLKLFIKKLSISSSFAHKFCKTSNKIISQRRE